MSDQRQRLVSWFDLPEHLIGSVFPDAERLGDLEVEFGTRMMHVYRFMDAVGNDAFAFGKDSGIVSHGSHILDDSKISQLRKAGAAVASS